MRRLSFVLVLSSGCFTAQLDPDAAGAFACGDDEPCPGDQSCVNERCEVGDPPRVEITNPERNQAFPIGDDPGGMRTFSINILGTLDLVDPVEHKDNVFGEGHLEVFLDNHSVGKIVTGALSGGVQFELEVANVAGPVRVAVHALRNDGSRYDNEDATATQLFWIDDGTPLVGIRNPWPGATFGLDAESVAVEAVVLNFGLMPANPNGTPQPGVGHVHIYYDVDLATCLVPDSQCDNSYITTVTMDKASPATFPKSAAGTAKLSAVLRNIDHSLFVFPPDMGGPITDEIEIIRE